MLLQLRVKIWVAIIIITLDFNNINFNNININNYIIEVVNGNI